MSARMDLPGAFFVTHFLRAREACIDTAITFHGDKKDCYLVFIHGYPVSLARMSTDVSW